MNVFTWREFGSWKNAISDCIGGLYSANELVEIFVESHDPISEFEESDFEEICCSIWETFTHLKTFHACKPVDPCNIHKEGLFALNIDDKIKEFKSIFPPQEYGITGDDIQYSINSLGRKEVFEIRAGSICVVLDDRIFKKRGSGHYLIYGSEFLLNLTLYLPDHLNPKSLTDVLLERGVPTVFTCLLPSKNLSTNVQKDIVLKILEEWSGWYGEPETVADRTGYTLFIKERISGDLIVDHYHPDLVENSLHRLYGPETYKPSIQCSMCSGI